MTNPHWYGLSVCGMVPTGISGPDARNAIADWQTARGLVADGVIGPATADAMHVEAVEMGVATLHFKAAEFLQGATLPDDWADRLRRTIRMAEVLRRDVFGGVACEILAGGGFRLESGGNGQAVKSQHLYMRACDIRPADKAVAAKVNWPEVYKTIDAMQADGRLEVGGCKVYTDQAHPFAHVDYRGNRARW